MSRADNRLPLGEEYVIITSAALSESFLPLISFKNSCGVSTAWADIDSILNYYSGVDSAEKLRNYLKDFYQAGGKYVLLGGDETILPVRYLLYYNAATPAFNRNDLMPSDLYFADLTGEWDRDGDGVWGEPTDDKPDFVPELKVGRLPARTSQSIQNHISKLLRYYTNPGNGNYSYLDKSLFFSSDEMRDYPAVGQHGVIAATFPLNFVTDTINGVELPSGAAPNPTNPDGASGIRKISEGYGIVNIIAHGRKDGFVVKSANYGDWPASFILTSPVTGGHGSILDLEKNGRTSFYYSLACDVGGYDLDSLNGLPADYTLVEKLLASENSGAVGMVANSRWGWVYSSYLLHQSFFKYLFGKAEGNPFDAMRYSWLDYPYLRDLIYGQNFLGDPSLKVYRQVPRNIKLVVKSSGEDHYQVEVTSGDYPIVDAAVVLARNGIILETGRTDVNGKWDLNTALNYDSLYIITAMAEGYVILQDNYSPAIAADIKDGKNILPDAFNLGQNYPNPFNPSTTIEYSLPKRAEAHFEIFNLLGQIIRTIETPLKPAGKYIIEWDGKNDERREVPSGIYFYRLTADRISETKKMILLR